MSSSQTPGPVPRSTHVLTAGLVAAAVMWVTHKRKTDARLAAAEARVSELTLRCLALENKDVQTLCGASARKDWLKACPMPPPTMCTDPLNRNPGLQLTPPRKGFCGCVKFCCAWGWMDYRHTRSTRLGRIACSPPSSATPSRHRRAPPTLRSSCCTTARKTTSSTWYVATPSGMHIAPLTVTSPL